jgi:hypothetical protein
VLKLIPAAVIAASTLLAVPALAQTHTFRQHSSATANAVDGSGTRQAAKHHARTTASHGHGHKATAQHGHRHKATTNHTHKHKATGNKAVHHHHQPA